MEDGDKEDSAEDILENDEGDEEDEYVYHYASDDDEEDAYNTSATSAYPSVGKYNTSPAPIFTGLDTKGKVNDMLLKNELTHIKPELETSRQWRVDLTWDEGTRTLGVRMTHENFLKAHLNLSFPEEYPQRPPHFQYIGPRFNDSVDFILAAGTFEPCRTSCWNETFSCSNLLRIVQELVKDKYPVTEELQWSDFEKNLITICQSRLPSIPKQLKEGQVYFGVRIEASKAGRRSTGVGYSYGGRDSHDFTVHDQKFQQQVDGLRRFLQLCRRTEPELTRLSHIEFGAWLATYLEEELPIFKFEQVHEPIQQAVQLVERVGASREVIHRVKQIFAERESIIKPACAGGRLKSHTSTEYVLPAVEEPFSRHHYKSSEGTSAPSMEVMKRIMCEIENLRNNLKGMNDGQIFVVFSEAQCLLWKVLLIPSSGTPYYGGCFEFHLAIPSDYPRHPPSCHFMTTGGGQVRFNPNLYNSGLPEFARHMAGGAMVRKLLMSILAFIFTLEPLKNEPGLEQSNEQTVKLYNAYLRLETLETAMIGQLKSAPDEFQEVIKEHFRQHWQSKLRPDLLQWGESHYGDQENRYGASLQGQIMRTQWFANATGADKYKKTMRSLVERMDMMVAAIHQEAGAPGQSASMQAKGARGAAAATGVQTRAAAAAGGGSASAKQAKR